MQLSEYKNKNMLICSMFSIILLTLNITKVVNFSENIKFNMAFSDLIIIFAWCYIWLDVYRKKTFKYIYGFKFCIALMSWLIFVGILSIQSNTIINNGWMGLIEELVKTGLCIMYFMVGYYTLNVLKFRNFKAIWSLSAVIFVFGGLLIYSLAITGQYFWTEGLQYHPMFMGTDTDPNHAATFLSITFFSFGLFSISAQRKNTRFLFFLVMIISVLGIVFTASRGGIIGLFFGILLLIVYYSIKNWRRALGLLFILVVIVLLFIQIDQSFFEGHFTERMLGKVESFESGFDIRWSLSHTALLMGNDYPITGVGRGNFAMNSSIYFEKINMNFIDDIPHNTYWGLYAEVGIIGLLLFLAPVYFIFKSFVDRYRNNRTLLKYEIEGLAWFLAGALSVGVQAFVLNVENRRFLWYFAGVLIYLIQSKENFLVSTNLCVSPLWRKLILFLPVVTLTLFIIVSYNAHFVVNPILISGNQLGNFKYELPIKALSLGSENDVGFKLSLPHNIILKDRIEVKIVEVNTEGDEITLVSRKYKSISGNVFLTFVPSTWSKSVRIEIKTLDNELDSYYFTPLSVISSNEVYNLDKEYFMQPFFLRDLLVDYKKTELETYYPQTSLYEGIGKTFSTKLKIVDVNTEKYTTSEKGESTTNEIKISISYEVTDSLKEDYGFLLLGFPYDLEGQTDSTVINGYEAYPLENPVYTSQWEVGKLYEVTFVLPYLNGINYLKNSILISNEDDLSYLMANEGQTNESEYMNLGWLNLRNPLLKD